MYIACDIKPHLLTEQEALMLRNRTTAELGIRPEDLPIVDGTHDSNRPHPKEKSFRIMISRLGLWEGKIEVRGQNIEFHKHVHRTIQGQLLKFGSYNIAVEVDHSFLELDTGAGPINSHLSSSRETLDASTNPSLSCINFKAGLDCALEPCPICHAPGGVRARGNS